MGGGGDGNFVLRRLALDPLSFRETFGVGDGPFRLVGFPVFSVSFLLLREGLIASFPFCFDCREALPR